MPHKVRLSRTAIEDFASIADWITDQANSAIALDYVDRIRKRCDLLADFPLRGRLRLKRKSIRSIPFERSATIFYRVDRREVLILRILRSGRNVDRELQAID